MDIYRMIRYLYSVYTLLRSNENTGNNIIGFIFLLYSVTIRDIRVGSTVCNVRFSE
jgi:hypothetical protein